MTGAKPTKRHYLMIVTLAAITACGDNENPNVAVGELASDRIELTAETNEPIVATGFMSGSASLCSLQLPESAT